MGGFFSRLGDCSRGRSRTSGETTPQRRPAEAMPAGITRLSKIKIVVPHVKQEMVLDGKPEAEQAEVVSREAKNARLLDVSTTLAPPTLPAKGDKEVHIIELSSEIIRAEAAIMATAAERLLAAEAAAKQADAELAAAEADLAAAEETEIAAITTLIATSTTALPFFKIVKEATDSAAKEMDIHTKVIETATGIERLKLQQ